MGPVEDVEGAGDPVPPRLLEALSRGGKPVRAEAVVLEFLQHEIATRPDIRASLREARLDEDAVIWLPAALQSPRGGLVRSLLSYQDWLQCVLPPGMVPSLTVHRQIPYRRELAPHTGTLRECATSLSKLPDLRREFEACTQAWKADSVDTKGMAAVRDDDEVSIVEGCHRLIGLAWLLKAEPEFRPSRDIPLYLGLSRRGAD